jgi:hypothetical protein
MDFPLTVPDIGLLLGVVAIILLVTSELLYASPSYAARIALDRRMMRLIAIIAGAGFLVTVLMRVMGGGA